MTTELAQRMKAAALNATGAYERLSVMPEGDLFDISLAEGTQLDADITALNSFHDEATPANVLALVTQDVLKEHLHYNPDTGVFTRIKNTKGGFKCGDIAGCIHHTGYRHIKINGKEYKAGRLAFLYMPGKFPTEADHINRVRNDDRWINLRNASRADNARNQKVHSHNTSGIKGVSWHKKFSKWYVTIGVDGRKLSLGLYDDIELAGLVSMEARRKYHGDFFGEGEKLENGKI
nr:MAG TPA: endonuclease [Caudoviricetes sp.]